MKIKASHLAKLANLNIAPDKLKTLESQIEHTITYVEKLFEVNTENVSQTNQVTGLENITREDKVESSFSQHDALKNAQATLDGMFKVKAVFEQEDNE